MAILNSVTTRAQHYMLSRRLSTAQLVGNPVNNTLPLKLLRVAPSKLNLVGRKALVDISRTELNVLALAVAQSLCSAAGCRSVGPPNSFN